MKKIIFAFALLLSVQFGMAQDAAFKEDALKLMKVSGSTATMDVAKKQIMDMIPKDKQAAFSVEFDTTMPALYDKLAAVFMKEYTHDDIKEMLKFYDTPIGKKMSSKAGTIFEQSTAAAQEWGGGLKEMLMKYMQ